MLEAIVSAAKLLPSVIQGASRLIIRPRLVLSVGQDAPWSVQTATTRPPIVNPIDWVNDGVMHYFRVQVKNRGKRTASGCHVTLTGVWYVDLGIWRRLRTWEAVDLAGRAGPHSTRSI